MARTVHSFLSGKSFLELASGELKDTITYQHGIPESLRRDAAILFDDAFGDKFSLAIRSRQKRIDLFIKSMKLEFAFAAICNEELVGMAGFHDAEGSLTGGIDYKMLIGQLGFWRGNRAAAIFSMYERKQTLGELLMDGISVRSDARGKGVGTRLLEMVQEHAISQGFQNVRLDVIDTNAGARRLYERKGFVETKTEHFGYLRWLFGFGAVSTMSFPCDSAVKQSSPT